MKATVQTKDILDAVQKVQTVVSTKSTLSILSNVLIETVDNALVLTATDLQVGIRCKCEARVKKEGASTIPAKTLFAILRELPEGDVTLEISEKDIASITCGESYFRILGISKDEFPKLPEFLEKESFTIAQSLMKNMLRKTIYAVSREDNRYALMGMYFIIANHVLTFVSTDGRRLSKITAELSADVKLKRDFIVPLKAVDELQKMLGDEGEVRLFLAKNQVAFQLDGVLLVSRLIDGTFPDYERVIPESSPEKAELDRREFFHMVRRVALLATDQANLVRLAFGKGQLVMTSSSPELGEARVSMPVKYEGKDVEIAFNPDFLKDVLTSMDEDVVQLELTDSLSPGVVRGEGTFLHVLMPMRLQDTE
ncbi:MAG: DNA polymerase III subunit beta [Verrucomicrobia bacterium]|nr:DNA polymerase III subunit beta [Verrucomicrobiota bacterium]